MGGTHLDSHLSQRLRRQKRSNVGVDRPVQTTHDNPVTLTKVTVRQDDVDSRTETLDDLDLENRAFELRDVHEALSHPLLGQVDEQHDHVGNTLASDGRRRDERDVSTEVPVLVVEARVHTLLSESEDGLFDSVGKLALDLVGLLSERFLERAVGGLLPAVDSINLSRLKKE